MDRKDINPWEWSKAFGFSQATELTGGERLLLCSGQTAIGPDGAPPTSTDMGEQIRASLANLATVLDAAGMTLADVVKLTIFTTDVDALLADYEGAVEVLAPNLPAMTLIGVARLAYPELLVEIEAVAAR